MIKTMKSLHRMFCLFWVSTSVFQVTSFFVDDFNHWYSTLGIFFMWLTLCVFSYLVNRGLKKEREILAAQHVKLMNEIKAQHQQDRELLDEVKNSEGHGEGPIRIKSH